MQGSQIEHATGLCWPCMTKTPGEAKACPSCGCPYVARLKHVDGWSWVPAIDGHTGIQAIHYCPEHGCDLEAEFHLARKEKKAGTR